MTLPALVCTALVELDAQRLRFSRCGSLSRQPAGCGIFP